jgi:hypothetical protein
MLHVISTSLRRREIIRIILQQPLHGEDFSLR